MKTDQDRIRKLTAYVQGIMDQEDGKELYLEYKKDIEQVTPQEAFEIFYGLLQNDKQPKEILLILDKIINVFYKSLANYKWEIPEGSSFMGILMQENRALELKLESIREIITEKGFPAGKKEMLPKICELQEFNHHYLKKENILFPYLEKRMEKFDGLAIMWALHDETRAQLKKVIECLEAEACGEAEFNTEIGKLFFAMHGLVKKEELILFPAASEVLEENELTEMKKQSMEYEFPFIEKPTQAIGEESTVEGTTSFSAEFGEGCKFETETGALDFEQLLMVFNALPVDMTFVDENNKVRFFTRPKDRIFPRSPAVIGRDVEKCHPPESVHVVNQIIDSFRAGTKDTATFWINLKGKMILIQYFALRDPSGEYRGVLEVSQDITEISSLQGEKRLLHWK